MWGGWGPEIPESAPGVPPVVASVAQYVRHRALSLVEAHDLNIHHIEDQWDRDYDLAADARRLAWNASPFAVGLERLWPRR